MIVIVLNNTNSNKKPISISIIKSTPTSKFSTSSPTPISSSEKLMTPPNPQITKIHSLIKLNPNLSKNKPPSSLQSSSSKVLNLQQLKPKIPNPPNRKIKSKRKTIQQKTSKNRKLLNPLQTGKSSFKPPKLPINLSKKPHKIQPHPTPQTILKLQIPINPRNSSLWIVNLSSVENLINLQESQSSPKMAKHYTILTSNLKLKLLISSPKSLASHTVTLNKLQNGHNKSLKSRRYSWAKSSLVIL